MGHPVTLIPPEPFGEYLLLEKLGEGGFGRVYLARPRYAGGGASPVVIKRMFPGSEVGRQRAEHEARVVQAVDSRHFPRVIEVGGDEDEVFIVMEHVEGWVLREVLREIAIRQLHISISSAVEAVLEGLRGLAALHEAVDPRTGLPMEIVHRDIKPGNLILKRDGALAIIDLGIGKSNTREWRTRTNALLGTLGYMSPQQVEGQNVDRRTDLYSMAIVLWELVAGRQYFSQKNKLERLEAMRSPVYRSVTELRPDVPGALDELLRRGLARAPEDRFDNAAEMISALDRAWPEAGRNLLDVADELLSGALEERTRLVATLLAAVPTDEGTTEPPLLTQTEAQAATRIEPQVLTQTEPLDSTTRPPLGTIRVRHGRPLVSSRTLTAVAGTGVVVLIAVVAWGALRRDPEPPSPIVLPVSARPSGGLPIGVEVVPKESAAAFPDPAPPAAAPEEVPKVERKPRPKAARTPTRAPPETKRRATRSPSAPRDESYSRLVARARRLKKAHADRAGEIDEIIADAALWNRATDRDKAKRALSELSTRLDRISD